MSTLQLQPNLHEPGKRYFRDFSAGDDFYEALIDTHRDLTDEQSEQVNARLVLLLANHTRARPVHAHLHGRRRRQRAGVF
jgi:hypothetical protein